MPRHAIHRNAGSRVPRHEPCDTWPGALPRSGRLPVVPGAPGACARGAAHADARLLPDAEPLAHGAVAVGPTTRSRRSCSGSARSTPGACIGSAERPAAARFTSRASRPCRSTPRRISIACCATSSAMPCARSSVRAPMSGRGPAPRAEGRGLGHRDRGVADAAPAALARLRQRPRAVRRSRFHPSADGVAASPSVRSVFAGDNRASLSTDGAAQNRRPRHQASPSAIAGSASCSEMLRARSEDAPSTAQPTRFRMALARRNQGRSRRAR